MSAINHGAALAGLGLVQAGAEEIASLRQRPDPTGAVKLPATLLKHSDEQTVVGIAALFRAIDTGGLRKEDFTHWGVVAAPRYVGRLACAAALARATREGVTAAPPLIIPHRSLHSLSGTISQALRLHGPNIGVGGGAGHLAEGLLAGLLLIEEGQLPGLWLVLTQWDPEPTSADSAAVTPVCHGLALALVPASSSPDRPRLRLVDGVANPAGDAELASVASLAELLTSKAGPRLCSFDWGAALEVDGPDRLQESRA